MSNSRPRLLLADDHLLVLEGLRSLLAAEFDVAGIVSDGRTLVEEAHRLRPDVVLVDISMPLLNGIEATRKICEELPGTRVIVVTQRTERPYAEEAFRAGASGYVLKQSAASELLVAVREVLAGRSFVTASLAKDLGRIGGGPNEMFARQLTPRQREVLQLVAEGKTVKEVAAILGISPKTVEFHKAALMQELGYRTTAELTRYALDQGILENSK